jgi:hypothetical protein
MSDNWPEVQPQLISQRVTCHDSRPLQPFATLAAIFPNTHIIFAIFLPGLPGWRLQRDILSKFCRHFSNEPAYFHVYLTVAPASHYHSNTQFLLRLLFNWLLSFRFLHSVVQVCSNFSEGTPCLYRQSDNLVEVDVEVLRRTVTVMQWGWRELWPITATKRERVQDIHPETKAVALKTRAVSSSEMQNKKKRIQIKFRVEWTGAT